MIPTLDSHTVAVVVALILAGWIAYLIFCAWLVWYTGKPKSLRDAAAIARAFPLWLFRRRRDK